MQTKESKLKASKNLYREQKKKNKVDILIQPIFNNFECFFWFFF